MGFSPAAAVTQRNTAWPQPHCSQPTQLQGVMLLTQYHSDTTAPLPGLLTRTAATSPVRVHSHSKSPGPHAVSNAIPQHS